jgi:hypothetical protein
LNVLGADGTVVFGDARSPGSRLTVGLCEQHDKPCCVIPPDADLTAASNRLRVWMAEHRIDTLNVAGNRASQASNPG